MLMPILGLSGLKLALCAIERTKRKKKDREGSGDANGTWPHLAAPRPASGMG